eukprot:CAMPEP_0175131330 /NCGR_PEP_ID=MMETSP0087-20121206/6484_1 /TAXON_ID=136419 /ORGANISM="Unknown Unknown, Strain D1" /LENGTH=1068 /DNA_ID=CAMNT_0016413611 /DNA_START=22 /DNA_END=3228 /DNA_ORIENTATION=+
MSAKAIREFDGKLMLSRWLKSHSDFSLDGFAQINVETKMEELVAEHPFLQDAKLVVKPDQLIKRRGKSGLILLNSTFDQVCEWLREHRNKEVQVEVVSGILDHFIVEKFFPHKASDEYYICIHSNRSGDEILFHHEGGVDIGDVDAKALRLSIPVNETLSREQICNSLLIHVPDSRKATLASFIVALYTCYKELHFAYLEINPLVMNDDGQIVPLDLAAKLDETAKFECGKHWGKVDFPPPFGRPLLPEEQYINELDSKTGASLKLTILNAKGRVWTMVAGGGASVIYADTLTDLGAGDELANYGEYSGAPTESLTFEYAKTILQLMVKHRRKEGKVLIIGGGIANFTNVGQTFKGIIRALVLYQEEVRSHGIKIFVRRAGPNYQQGLEAMRSCGTEINVPIKVYGPEAHMTSIVAMALGKDVKDIPTPLDIEAPLSERSNSVASERKSLALDEEPNASYNLFTNKTRAFVYGLQTQAVQNMLDFDFICGREQASVAAMIYPFNANHYQKFYWNTTEILIPVFESFAEAMTKFPEVDVVVNFSSFRSVYESTLEILNHGAIKTIAIIAEGVPERRTRDLLKRAQEQKVNIIGPATVGGIKPGCFRIGNTGGMLDNIIASKLYRPGSVAYVARSGGMSNEMNNIISRNSDGVYEGVAIGGDRYPGTTFVDHLLRYQANPAVKLMIVLGEVGGVEEYEICRLIEEKVLTKPIIAWCIGTCAKIFPYEVQFGHAGACANGDRETADAKNLALKSKGVFVPASFEDFGVCIREQYEKLVASGDIVPRPEPPKPTIPVDYDWARKLGLVRKPAAFVSSIVDERGDELMYAGMKISEVFEQNLGVGGVLGLIWFRRRLPEYFCKFIELVLMITADHGPAVSGAHNTIVCARAGKDLISSLCSGLLTIGPRFGGALDGAAAKFTWAFDSGMTPEEFVNHMRNSKELILGIGHKIKSLENPDARVVIVKDFCRANFKSTEILDYACEVEQITSKKKSNLILNVDGAIGAAFVDLLRSCGAFTMEEAAEYVDLGTLNGLFVLGRSLGFIGHFLDQNRLKQGLYRHPVDDISYLSPLV